MAENSKIEWTHHTFNPWRGCTKVSPGCAHCYAETQAKRNPGTLGIWGDRGTRVVAAESYWRQPEKWNREAACLETFDCANGDHADCCPQRERPRVFCASMADVFEADRPVTFLSGESHGETLDDQREKLFNLIYETKNLDWLLLTKRPENIVTMVGGESGAGATELEPGGIFDNVWLGTSVESADYYHRIEALRQTPATIRFLSCEPLLGPLPDLPLDGIHWVIVGGESGPNARPMHPDWARSIRDQCRAAGVAFFFKQWGEHQPADVCIRATPEPLRIDTVGRDITDLPGLWNDETDAFAYRVGKKVAGRLLDGRTHDDFPQRRAGDGAATRGA